MRRPLKKFKNSKVLAIAIILLIASPANFRSAQGQSLYDGYWKYEALEGEQLECIQAETEALMLSTLKRAGYVRKTIPDIEWNTNYALIIASKINYDNADVEFFGAKPEGKVVYLQYGWKKRKPPDPSTNCKSGQTCSSSLGSRDPPYPHVLIVSVRKSELVKREWRCENIGVIN